MALAVAHERVLAGVLQPHRPAGTLREQGEIHLDGEVLLAAEAAADQRPADADLVVGNPDGVGDGPEVLDHLGGDADVHHVVLVHPREPHLGLQEGVFLERSAERVLDDDVGLSEPRLDVALPDPSFRDDVVGRGDDRGARLHRLQRVVDTGDGLELELDQLHGVVRDVAALRRDQRKGLAEVPDPLPHQDLLTGIQALLADLPRDVGRGGAVGKVVGGEDACDAFEGPRPRDVEARKPGARDVRAHHPHVQHAGHHVVARVRGAAGDLAGRVGAGERPPDLPEPDVGPRLRFDRRSRHCPSLPARMAAAASLTASNTLV